MLSCLFIAALWSPAGIGLTSWLSCMHVMFPCDFVIFPCGVLGQAWYMYLIVSMPDLCLLHYFNAIRTKQTELVIYLLGHLNAIYLFEDTIDSYKK